MRFVFVGTFVCTDEETHFRIRVDAWPLNIWLGIFQAGIASGTAALECHLAGNWEKDRRIWTLRPGSWGDASCGHAAVTLRGEISVNGHQFVGDWESGACSVGSTFVAVRQGEFRT